MLASWELSLAARNTNPFLPWTLGVADVPSAIRLSWLKLRFKKEPHWGWGTPTVGRGTGRVTVEMKLSTDWLSSSSSSRLLCRLCTHAQAHRCMEGHGAVGSAVGRVLCMHGRACRVLWAVLWAVLCMY